MWCEGPLAGLDEHARSPDVDRHATWWMMRNGIWPEAVLTSCIIPPTEEGQSMGGCRLWSRAGNIGSRNGLARDLPSDRGRMCAVASELHRPAIGGDTADHACH